MNPELPPLITVPTELSDEAAAQLLELLYALADAFESHYAGQLLRYYRRGNDDNTEPQPPVMRDPPF